jgi:uncharacterized tellurite resistance protein B-like protein
MRHYPRNSPEAAASLLALSLLADGDVSAAEMRRLSELDVNGRLGLPAGGFESVIQTLCEDLMACADGSGLNGLAWHQLDQHTLCSLLDEVSDTGLQLIVLQLCGAAIDADAHVADDERRVLQRLADHWKLPAPVLRAPNAYRDVKAAIAA